MTEQIPVAAKEKVKELLAEYDIRFIDYKVAEDEYTIKLEKLKKENK